MAPDTIQNMHKKKALYQHLKFKEKKTKARKLNWTDPFFLSFQEKLDSFQHSDNSCAGSSQYRINFWSSQEGHGQDLELILYHIMCRVCRGGWAVGVVRELFILLVHSIINFVAVTVLFLSHCYFQ